MKFYFSELKQNIINSVTYGEDVNQDGQTLVPKASFILYFASF